MLLKLRGLERLLLRNCGLNDLLIEGLVDGLLLNEENLEVVSQRCNMSSDRKLVLRFLDLSHNWSVSEKGWLKLLMGQFSI